MPGYHETLKVQRTPYRIYYICPPVESQEQIFKYSGASTVFPYFSAPEDSRADQNAPSEYPLTTKPPRDRISKLINGKTEYADVVELADTLDLGSSAAKHAGSSPVIRTKVVSFYYECWRLLHFIETILAIHHSFYFFLAKPKSVYYNGYTTISKQGDDYNVFYYCCSC